MVDVSLAASMRLRGLVRAAGVIGMPAIRVRSGAAQGRPDDVEMVIEDRGMPGDEINESRGLRFYMDDRTVSSLGDVVLDLEGDDFVVRANLAG